MRNYILYCIAGLFLISCSESSRFKLLTSKQTGITFNNIITETDSFHVMSYEYIYNGAGVGVGDLNNDGLQDLIFAANQVSPRIYLNMGNFKFKDITANFAGLTNDQWFSSVTVADINSDSRPDVYFTSTANKDPLKCKNRLWINQGASAGNDPTFTEMAEQYGIAHDGQSINAAFFDYDLDGDLDLYVMNNTLTQRMNTSYRPKITDGSAQNNDRLYRNNGNGSFSDVTIEAGIVYEGFGLGLALGDVNKDGYPDIYVSNDYISNDLLYINQRNGTFRNEIRKYMSYQTKSSMGNDMADVNNDGYPDMFTLDMMPEYYYKKRQTINGFSYQFYVNDYKYDYEHQYLRNMLHLHNGLMNGEMLPYSEVGQMMGIYQTEWSWSPLFADFDNDGDKDLIVANGYPRDMTDKDWTRYKAEVYGFLADEKAVIAKAPAVKVPNMAYENFGDLQFRKTREWLPDIPSYSYGASFVDLDNDGDLDYVTNNLDDEAFICRNYTVEKSKDKANYIRVRLTGKDANTMALGAKIELWSKGGYQFTEHFLTRGYASSVDPVIHFGLSGDASVDSIRVTWPASGNISVLKSITANQVIDIDENTALQVKVSPSIPAKNKLIFEKRENVIDYLHEQTDYVDFYYDQNIIPHKFSQIGPCMTQGDLDGDGLVDLIIGSTNIQPTTVLLRKGERFERTELKGLTTLKEFSESDLAIVDIDKDGDNDVIAIAGGYENPKESEYQHYLYRNNDGSFERSGLSLPPFPASVIRPFDFDHDGDLDLFIGARVKKAKFPYSNHSWLVHNDQGKLVTDTLGRFNLGMVTDAIWTDYDLDGWEDLLVAREWNSLTVLKNMNGKELVPQSIPALENQCGFWYTVIAGDFDQDGDDDYIAGNLGNNHRFTISEKYPMQVYAIDLDLDGIVDPLTTAYWLDQQDVMREYPVNYLDELWAQSTFFQKKFRDYTSFSLTSIDDMLDAATLKQLDFKLKVNTTASYVIWNDKGRLTWEELPLPLQVSAIRKMIVRDLNEDTYPDILVSGNDYTFDVSTGYYDALKGLVLMSKGKEKSFKVLTPAQSGILLQGMIGSLLYLDGDTSMIVAGMNRAKIEVFKKTGK